MALTPRDRKHIPIEDWNAETDLRRLALERARALMALTPEINSVTCIFLMPDTREIPLGGDRGRSVTIERAQIEQTLSDEEICHSLSIYPDSQPMEDAVKKLGILPEGTLFGICLYYRHSRVFVYGDVVNREDATLKQIAILFAEQILQADNSLVKVFVSFLKNTKTHWGKQVIITDQEVQQLVTEKRSVDSLVDSLKVREGQLILGHP